MSPILILFIAIFSTVTAQYGMYGPPMMMGGYGMGHPMMGGYGMGHPMMGGYGMGGPMMGGYGMYRPGLLGLLLG